MNLQIWKIVEEEQMLNKAQLQRKTEIQTELIKLYELEELYWNERSNNTWLLNGDGNTEYFHRIANKKKEGKTPFSLYIMKTELLRGMRTFYLMLPTFTRIYLDPAINHQFNSTLSVGLNQRK